MRRRSPVGKRFNRHPPQLTSTLLPPSSASVVSLQSGSSAKQRSQQELQLPLQPVTHQQQLQAGHVSVWQGQSTWEQRMLQGSEKDNTPHITASNPQIRAAGSRSSLHEEPAISARQSSRSQSHSDTTTTSLTSPSASAAAVSDSSRCGIGIRVKFSGKGEISITVQRLKHSYSPPQKVWAGWWSRFDLEGVLLSVFRSARCGFEGHEVCISVGGRKLLLYKNVDHDNDQHRCILIPSSLCR